MGKRNKGKTCEVERVKEDIKKMESSIKQTSGDVKHINEKVEILDRSYA